MFVIFKYINLLFNNLDKIYYYTLFIVLKYNPNDKAVKAFQIFFEDNKDICIICRTNF